MSFRGTMESMPFFGSAFNGAAPLHFYACKPYRITTLLWRSQYGRSSAATLRLFIGPFSPTTIASHT